MCIVLRTEIHVNGEQYKFKDDPRNALIALSKDIPCAPVKTQEFDYEWVEEFFAQLLRMMVVLALF